MIQFLLNTIGPYPLIAFAATVLVIATYLLDLGGRPLDPPGGSQ